MSESPVFFTLVNDRDLKKIKVAKDVIYVTTDEIWLGTCEGNTFTSEKRGLYNPNLKTWFVLHVNWRNADEGGSEHIATNGDIFTYVRHSLAHTRIPFTDTVKKEINWRIDQFWRSQ